MITHLLPAETKPSRVVVLGGSGFVGAAVVDALCKEEIPVVSFGSKELDLLADAAVVDLSKQLDQNDHVVFASAIAPCKTTGMLVDNVRMASALCDAISINNVKHLTYISSDAVYGDFDGPITESSTLSNQNLHGAMHVVRERMLLSLKDTPLCILRPTLIYGSRDPHNGYGPNLFRRNAQKGHDITLFGEGEELRDHVSIKDVAAIAVRCIVRGSEGVLNVATGKVFSFKNIADEINRLYGGTVKVNSTVRSGPMPHNGYRAFDPTATRSAFPDFKYTELFQGLSEIAKSGSE